jgi:predicted DNA-binding transcriptional regulator YafY
MGERLKYERFLWFHDRVKASRYPNARHLAERFEISPRTAQRELDFIRDRLRAPLEYDHTRKGYYYTDDSFELPSNWYSEDSVISFALAVRLASTIPDTRIKNELYDFIGKLFKASHQDTELDITELSEKISVKNIEYSRVNEEYFNSIVNALFHGAPLFISYYSPHSKKETERTVMPLHLMQYMGSWHLIAFCALRNDIRDFALSRIRSMDLSDENIHLPDDLPPVKEFTRKHFGIIQGGRTRNVCLRFAPDVADWIEEQIWHPDQEQTIKKDGSLELRFPAADFKELIKRILSHGSDVKVVAPKGLIDEVKKEIMKMNFIYD